MHPIMALYIEMAHHMIPSIDGNCGIWHEYLLDYALALEPAIA